MVLLVWNNIINDKILIFGWTIPLRHSINIDDKLMLLAPDLKQNKTKNKTRVKLNKQTNKYYNSFY